MAGSEQTGLEAARAELFDGAACIVTPDARTDAAAVAAVRAFLAGPRRPCPRTLARRSTMRSWRWSAIFPICSPPRSSISSAEKNAAAFDFAGPGFRDTTRVASGPPEMWAEILRSNRAAVRASVEAMIEKLREIATLLDHDASMTEFLTQAKTQRDQLRFPKSSHA